MKKLLPAVVLVTLIGLAFAASFVGALHQPEPHGVPVGVVAPAQVAGQIDAGLAAKKPGAFEIKSYADEAAARTALGDREVEAVVLPQQAKLIVASAGGRTASTVVTQVFTGLAQAQGQQLTVEDAYPLPAGDTGGVSGMFYVLALVIPGIAIAVLAGHAGVGAGQKVAVIALASVTVALANAWLADSLFGALPGAYLGLTAVSAAVVFTLGVVVAGLVRVVGTPGVGLAALLFVVIGVPASGGPLGPRFIPEWYAAIGQTLPIGQGTEAIRNTVFFDGAALTVPLTVLAAWTLAGLLLLFIPVRRTAATATPAAQPVPVA
ncbi:membrane protein [Acrocarpospora phusangensis]|uniref:Membrane protein n=1 Tax=Acrocarpospora phusangensis TaxID=1070424 RepID=A0A919UPV4_9ACTN|nr:hypothetical protein [Acrocarpospora phusangensis]GIH29194.1 membrane protein [Acrocarpospora phusangensis]